MAKWILELREGKKFTLPAKFLNKKHIKSISSETVWKILHILSETPTYPKDIAKKLRIHEQKIYYHIKNLEKAGIIKVTRHENMHGVIAKIYEVEKPAFAILLEEMEEVSKLPTEENEFLYPHIKDGRLETLIVIGSHESHGPKKTKAKDAPFAINLGLFLGTFLAYAPSLSVKTDTEIKNSDLRKNLIIIGGPAVNKICEQINNVLPIKFIMSKEHFYSGVYSTVSKKKYENEETGIVVKIKNPFNKDKSIIVLAGRRSHGTKSAIFALMRNINELSKGNKYKPNVFAKVVEGIDADSDGVIDSVEIKE